MLDSLDVLLDPAGKRRQADGRVRRRIHRLLERRQSRELRHIADAGKHDRQDAGILHDDRHRRRARRHHQAAHLVADALARQRAQSVAGADRRRQTGSIDIARAVLGVEAEEAQDAQPVLGNPPVGVADEADAPGDNVGIAADRIVHVPAASTDSALTVKSRRMASAVQSWPKRTTAWRPSVSMSSRSVVTSIAAAGGDEVSVPCSTPVGTDLEARGVAASVATSSGVAVVPKSISPTGRPISALRTAPPTMRTSSAPAASAAKMRLTCRRGRASRRRRDREAVCPGRRRLRSLEMAGDDVAVLVEMRPG